MKFAFIKKKKVYIPLIIFLVVGFFGYRSYKQAHQPPSYETAKVMRGNLVQTVEATGKIESIDNIALRFEIPGTLGKINVKEGQAVQRGTILATLNLAELNAMVAQARANLDKQLAGATDQDKQYYASAVEAAKASLAQAKVDAETTIKAAEAGVATVANNLKLAEGGNQSQIVSQAYETVVGHLQTTLSKLDDAVTQADNILGIDNISANDVFERQLSPTDPGKVEVARMAYYAAKQERDNARVVITKLRAASNQSDIDQGMVVAENALNKAINVLSSVSFVLNNTTPGADLTQSLLDSKKTIIETTRSSVTAQYSTIIAQKQALVNAKNSLSTYTIAYNKAVQDLEQAKANSENGVKIKEAALAQAEVNYDSKIKPPRPVDIASYRAALAQAVASRDKGIIRAPIDGVVTKVNKKVGELMSGGDVMIQMLSPHYEVKVDISEVDVRKVQLGDDATITLDAFGTDTKLQGSVLAIDPGPTVIQDVVYYKVRIALFDATSTTSTPAANTSTLAIKSGMTANITITTDKKDQTLYVPARAVKFNEEGERYIKVLENGNEKEYSVRIGLKANEGKQEILEGVEEGWEVILSKKEKK